MTVAIKGWCPGALRPMESGDGLIVRVRPRCGALTAAQAYALAEIAERLGNSQIELTRRANLQIRGVRPDGLPELHVALDRLGLLDPDVETEAARNVMVAPLAGIDPETVDVRPLARELEARCLRGLPAKFGMLVDGGGAVSIAGERADIALRASDGRVAVGIDTPSGTRWLGLSDAARAADVALALAGALLASGAKGRMRDAADIEVDVDLEPLAIRPPGSHHRVGAVAGAVGVAAPFGHLEARQLAGLAAWATEELRLSPWRTLYIPTRDDAAMLQAAIELGLIVDPTDALLRVDACPGAPSCTSATVDSRGDALRLAARGTPGTLHVSGCAKGCARSAPADLVLVGDQGRYGVIRNGTPHERPEHWLTPDQL
ncbi:MAG: precorrin-3B synthase [Enhydrobacter sp.]|nr:MAG: precorrin-3B synthase [Enhydrobacter sp.]